MTGLILLSILAVTPANTYRNPKDFLKKHGMTLTQVCRKYRARDCVIKKESDGTIDELGYKLESGTFDWCLYGKRGGK